MLLPPLLSNLVAAGSWLGCKKGSAQDGKRVLEGFKGEPVQIGDPTIVALENTSDRWRDVRLLVRSFIHSFVCLCRKRKRKAEGIDTSRSIYRRQIGWTHRPIDR